jgi:hypothetical protein
METVVILAEDYLDRRIEYTELVEMSDEPEL